MAIAPNFNLPNEPQPAWEVALLFPPQGQWSEGEYLALTDSTNRLVELVDGRIKVLQMPTTAHQLMVDFLLDALKAFIKPRKLRRVLFAPLRLKVRPGSFREPDLVFLLAEHAALAGNAYWQSADLVVEVVSADADSRKRDLVEKRGDYAAAGIAEYWMVDPLEQQITVLALEGDAYVTHGEFHRGAQATSRLLEGFHVDVSATFAVAEEAN